jgi:hypothetical protein
VNTTFSSAAPDNHALLAGPRLLRQADRGENEEARPITCEGGGGEYLSQNQESPGRRPQHTPKPAGTVYAGYLPGISPVYLPC